MTDPFPPNLQVIINPKPIELESWNFERMFTLHHVSHVTCHVSHVRCQIFCFTMFLVSITSVGHIVPVYKAMILWAGLQCILSVQWVITKKSYHPKTKMKKSSRIQIPCKHWSTALRTNLCKIASKTNTSRAGL